MWGFCGDLSGFIEPMGRRDAIKMTDAELAGFLAAESKVQVATVGKDGAPHLVTMFYTLWEGKIAFTTYRSSQKVVNLRRNSVMTCLVEGGDVYNELRGATLHGHGRIVTDPSVLLQLGTVIGHRMAGIPLPPHPTPPLSKALPPRWPNGWRS